MSLLFDWQTTLYGLLNGDVTLSAKITGVYDHVPQDTKAPYVSIGQFDSDDFSTHQKDGEEISTMIHIWTVEVKGNKQALEILKDVDRILVNRSRDGNTGASIDPITLTDGCLIAIYRGRVTTIPGIDGLNRHTIARYRVQLSDKVDRVVT